VLNFPIHNYKGGELMEIYNWHKEKLGERTAEALRKNEFDAVYFSTAKEASDFIMKHVSPGIRVGFGGSMTIKEMGIQDKVREAGSEVLDHGVPGLSPEERMSILRGQLVSDLFLCGSNAVTMDGKLVNIDNTGNRVGAMTFGPKKVIIVASLDKVCKDERAAFERLEGVAAPMNNKRLNTPNPCTKIGSCANCQLESRICRIYSVLRKKPKLTDITVVIVGESCGY
jgi:hypothetical protein